MGGAIQDSSMISKTFGSQESHLRHEEPLRVDPKLISSLAANPRDRQRTAVPPVLAGPGPFPLGPYHIRRWYPWRPKEWLFMLFTVLWRKAGGWWALVELFEPIDRSSSSPVVLTQDQ